VPVVLAPSVRPHARELAHEEDRFEQFEIVGRRVAIEDCGPLRDSDVQELAGLRRRGAGGLPEAVGVGRSLLTSITPALKDQPPR